ncbi:MAG: tetratricopeptide repeat protein [Thermodesulfobacteriota bacterium]|nr:tetratricopeptide repeat protein [Thermodesulfobacteriota bacterium]
MREEQKAKDKLNKAARLWIGFSLILVVTCLACAPRGRVRLIKPGKVRWESIHNLAVRGFDGHYGDMVRSHIYNRLSEIQHFSPTDAVQVYAGDKLPSNTLEEVEFLQAVENLKADAVITGHVTAKIHDIHGFDHLQVKEGTGYYKKAKDAYGQWVDEEIKRTMIKDVPFVIRKASFSGHYKVFDLEARGGIVHRELQEAYEEKFGGEEQHRDFGRKLSDLPTSSHTSEQLSERIADTIVTEISRMRLMSLVKLDKGKNSMVKRGVALAKRGRWREAIEAWEQVIRDDPDSAAAYYNLGVAHEGVGDMESLNRARDLYMRAASLRERKLYEEGVTRVASVIQEHLGDYSEKESEE